MPLYLGLVLQLEMTSIYPIQFWRAESKLKSPNEPASQRSILWKSFSKEILSSPFFQREGGRLEGGERERGSDSFTLRGHPKIRKSPPNSFCPPRTQASPFDPVKHSNLQQKTYWKSVGSRSRSVGENCSWHRYADWETTGDVYETWRISIIRPRTFFCYAIL